MVKTHILKIRMSKEQHERIQQTARKKGYLALAPYIRDLLFNHGGISIEQSLSQIERRLERLELILK